MKKVLTALFMTIMLVTSLSVSAKEVISASDKTFATEIKEGYALVDFWAEWCGPCRAFAPTFESLSQDFSGKVKFIKVNVDYACQTANIYQIRAIPTLILFKDAKVVKKWVGGMSKEDLKSQLSDIIK